MIKSILILGKDAINLLYNGKFIINNGKFKKFIWLIYLVDVYLHRTIKHIIMKTIAKGFTAKELFESANSNYSLPDGVFESVAMFMRKLEYAVEYAYCMNVHSSYFEHHGNKFRVTMNRNEIFTLKMAIVL